MARPALQLIIGSVLFAGVFAACGPRKPPHTVQPPNACNDGATSGRPLIVEWSADERAILEAAVVKGGVLAVRYSRCKLEIAPDCRAGDERYTYGAEPRGSDRVIIRSGEQLATLLPKHAETLAKSIEHGETLTATSTVVGAYRSPRTSMAENDFSGTCAGVSHFVRAASVGAFLLTSGSRTLRNGGDEARCGGAKGAAPPAGCDSIVALDLALIEARKHPGDTCNDGDSICDATGMLVCREGHFVALPCRGQKSCHRAGAIVTCDDEVAEVGDACKGRDHYACSADHKTSLVCDRGHFELWRNCRGPEGCAGSAATGGVHCDTSVAAVDDPCGDPGTYACGADGFSLLKCEDGKLERVGTCRGPSACRFDASRKARCDDSIALAGDPCDSDGEKTCAVDRKNELVCVDGIYEARRQCKRKGGCLLREGNLFCEDGDR